jgi:hypothetical protein
MKLKLIRLLLWMVRAFGFDVAIGQHMIYRWVKTADGRFDHWVESPTEQFDIFSVLSTLGFSFLARQILANSRLILGRERIGYKYCNELSGAMYACHGKRELLFDGALTTAQLNAFETAKWLVGSVKQFDHFDSAHSDVHLRAAGGNLRAAALQLVEFLAQTDPSIEKLLQNSFPPFD